MTTAGTKKEATGGNEKLGTGGRKLGTAFLETGAALSWLKPGFTKHDYERLRILTQYVGLDTRPGTGARRKWRADELLMLYVAYQVGSHAKLPADSVRGAWRAGRLPAYVVWSEPDKFAVCFDGDAADALRTILHFDVGRMLFVRDAALDVARMTNDPRAHT